MFKLKANMAIFSWSDSHASNNLKKHMYDRRTKCLALFLITFHLSNPRSAGQADGCPSLQSLHSSFDHRFSIEIRGPIHQVEGPKQHWKHYPGHLINLADAVVSLFWVRSLWFRRFKLNSCAVWNSGDGCILCQVGCVIHTGWTGVVWLFRQSQGVFFLGRSK